jgi:hypothetical protein
MYYRFKWKTENGSPGVIQNPFTISSHRANGSLPFVLLLTKKLMEVIHLQTDFIGLAHL